LEGGIQWLKFAAFAANGNRADVGNAETQMLNHQQMTFVLQKIKWHLERSRRGKTRTFFALFPDEAFSLRIVMEVGNGNVTSEQEVEAVTYEEGSLHSTCGPSRNR
jgi:hypothetical protein